MALFSSRDERGASMSLNIGIIGTGAVGGYFGSKLCRLIPAQGGNVYFIARGQHLDAIRQNGLSVKTAAEGNWICHPTLATDDFTKLPVLDVCLVCVKAYDLPDVSRKLRQCVSESTAIIPLLNGIDIYERMRAELDVARIFPGCTYIGVHIDAPGEIAQRGGDSRILFGRDSREPEFKPQFIFELFDQSSIGYEWLEDISAALWRKYIFIASLGLVLTAFDKTLGQVMETPRLSDYVQAVMEEITALARKKGVDLPADIVDQCYEHGRDFAYKTKTSFQRDFEQAGKPDERDLLAGTILRLGRQSGTETPATRELWHLLERRKPC
jgi:2-dehydropantoate 2-reductase